MRTPLCFLLTFGLLATASIASADRSVHLRPDSSSPVIGKLNEGDPRIAPADPVELSQGQREAGWEAISYLDDFRGFVRRGDVGKDLTVNTGARIYLSAEADPDRVIARAAARDLFEIEKLAGDWIEVSFRKPVTGFVRSGSGEMAPAPVASVVDNRIFEAELPEIEDIPAPKAEESASSAARAAKAITSRDGIPVDGLLRLYEGRLDRSRSFLGRQPPYSFQVRDHSGNRIAYVDLDKLLITTPIDRFLDRNFQFYGKAEPIEGRRDFVIRVEHMRLN